MWTNLGAHLSLSPPALKGLMRAALQCGGACVPHAVDFAIDLDLALDLGDSLAVLAEGGADDLDVAAFGHVFHQALHQVEVVELVDGEGALRLLAH